MRRLRIVKYFAFILLLLVLLCPSGAWAGQRPYIPMFTVDTASSAYQRFKAFVDRAVAGNPDYGFSAFDAAIMYRVTGGGAYADLAIAEVEAQVSQAETSIAAGQAPAIAHDSYLYVGDNLEDLATIYDWLYDRLTAQQRSRWAAYAEQAVYNVWHPSQASWGGKPFPWSGWSTSNPGNNYFYSFIQATMDWALASQNQTWLDFLNNDRLPLLVNYFKQLPGGGSREGTGYGSSHMRLFDIYRVWKGAAGYDLCAQSTHCRDEISYWLHATVPTLDRFAPIGDQARESTATMYDYQRRVVLEAVALNLNSTPAAEGTWWLRHIVLPYAGGLDRMSSGFNYKYDLLPENQTETPPAALVYYASGVGQLFARSSWNTNAAWLSFIAGRYEESHAHADQGSFLLYKDRWLALDENINTHSGIKQRVELHNAVRFDKGGSTIEYVNQFSTSSMSYTDLDGVLTINADLSPAYSAHAEDVRSWQRELVYDRSQQSLRVHDLSSSGAGVQAVWQINVPDRPLIYGNTVQAGALVITVVTPVNPQISLVNWSSIDPQEYLSGWRVEIRGGSEYTVNLMFGDNINIPPAPPSGLRRN